MSCQKLSRKFVHLVSNEGRGLNSFTHINISSLFYPSAAAAETAAKKKKKVMNKLGVVGSIGRYPKPSICYSSYMPAVPNPYSSVNVFALLGEGRNQILCSDAAGNCSVYHAELNSFDGLPELNSPKGSSSVAVSIPCNAAADSDDNNTDSLYILDMWPVRMCSFEVLSCSDPAGGEWSWRPLPPPPFFDDPEYKARRGVSVTPFTVVDGTSIWVSTATATYSFDTLACEWSKVGDWSLPFKAEYVSELGLWLGLSDRIPYSLCALEGLSAPTSSAVGSSTPPAVVQVGKEFEPPNKDWLLLMHTLVNVGSCRFCVVRVFDIVIDHGEYDAIQVVVFTGVEVSPSQPGLRMIRHKTKSFIGSIEQVL